MSRVLLLGATSMVGWSIVQLGKEGVIPVCSPFVRHRACNNWRRTRLEDEYEMSQLLRSTRPDLVIHCGGICDVHKCEQYPRFAEQLNIGSIYTILRHLSPRARFVYVSSDHVFGAGGNSFDEAAATCPISHYGRVRVAAENLVITRDQSLVIRSGLGIGPSFNGKIGHLDWLKYRTARNLPMTIVRDEMRSAVWANALASRVWQLAHSSIPGIRHIVASRTISRLELANFLNRRFSIGARFSIESRHQQSIPHIGSIPLTTRYQDSLAEALPCVASLPPIARARIRSHRVA